MSYLHFHCSGGDATPRGDGQSVVSAHAHSRTHTRADAYLLRLYCHRLFAFPPSWRCLFKPFCFYYLQLLTFNNVFISVFRELHRKLNKRIENVFSKLVKRRRKSIKSIPIKESGGTSLWCRGGERKNKTWSIAGFAHFSSS